MSASISPRRSTRNCRTPDRYSPSHIHTEKKEPLKTLVLPVLDLSDTCCICMEDVDTKKNRATTECGHTFCASCLFRYLEDNDTCPLCRIALRRPVKKTPILTSPVAESLITGISNSREEQEALETTAREMYVEVIYDIAQNGQDGAVPSPTPRLRTRMLQLLREYQIMWGINVSREISQWMQYVSSNPTELPEISEVIEDIPPPPPPPPPVEISDSDRDIMSYLFEININEPIRNHIESQMIHNIGVERIISHSFNQINNVDHYRHPPQS